MALPGAPEPIREDQPHPGWRDGVYRGDDGIWWVLAQECGPDGKWTRGDWLPSLADDATGGVLLGMLPASRTVDMDHGFVSIVVFTGAGYARKRGTTLAEAVARVAVALGRAR